jgi:hypothetical protein
MKKFTATALLLLSSLSLFSEEMTPSPPLKALLLLPEEEEKSADASGVTTRNLTIPGGAKALEEELAKLCLGKAITPELLTEIKQTIIRYFRAHGRPVVTVTIPEQDITDGVVEVIVVEAKRQGLCSEIVGLKRATPKLSRHQPGEAISNDTLHRCHTDEP